MFKLCVENKIPTPQIFNTYKEIKKLKKKNMLKKNFWTFLFGIKIIKKIKKDDFEKRFFDTKVY